MLHLVSTVTLYYASRYCSTYVSFGELAITVTGGLEAARCRGL